MPTDRQDTEFTRNCSRVGGVILNAPIARRHPCTGHPTRREGSGAVGRTVLGEPWVVSTSIGRNALQRGILIPRKSTDGLARRLALPFELFFRGF
jgi:hypothetical protein